MPNVNLIAARREEKKRVTALTRQLFMGFVASGVALVSVIFFTLAQKVLKQNEINALEAQLAALQPKLDEIKKREDDIKAMRPRIEALDSAKASTLRFRSLMAVLSETVPSYIWITNLATTGGTADTWVNMSGTGPSQASVAETVQNMDRKGVFERLDLVSTSNVSTPEDPIQRVSFRLNAHLHPVVLNNGPAAATTPTTTAASSARP